MTLHMLHADIRLRTYRGNHHARAREVLAHDASPILAQDAVAERTYRHLTVVNAAGSACIAT